MPRSRALGKESFRLIDQDVLVMDRTSFGDRVLAFWASIEPPGISTPGVDVMDPRSDPRAMAAMTEYYKRFFTGHQTRVFMIGINPGRFGGGIKGIPFTDPVALRDEAGIETTFDPRRELSSEFIYAFIREFGGLAAFSDRFYLTAVCPFGLLRDGKNINYYDLPALQRELEPYVVETMADQLAVGARRDVAIVVGTGKNATYLNKLNAQHRWFERLVVLEHPRFIMQYRRRRLGEYLEKYVAACHDVADARESADEPDDVR